jgi:hypothetical protein
MAQNKTFYVVYNPHTKLYRAPGGATNVPWPERLTGDIAEAQQWSSLDDAESAAFELEIYAVERGWREGYQPGPGWGVYELKLSPGSRIWDSLTRDAKREVSRRRKAGVGRLRQESRRSSLRDAERDRRMAQIDRDLKNWKPT